MKEENKNFRRRKNDKKKKSTFNLGIKVGDWFEDISGSELGLKDFYMVKSLTQTSVGLVEIGTDNGELSEVLCGDYKIKNFKKVKDILKYDHLKLKKIGGDEAKYRLKKVNGVSLILECFGIDQKKVRPQNPSSTQSTASENKPGRDLDIKVGDWFEIPQVYEESKGKVRKFLRVDNATPLGIKFKEVNVKPTNPDDNTIDIDEGYWLMEYFNKNSDGTFFWKPERGSRLDFERRDINVVRKEVIHCLNLEVGDELQHLGLLEASASEQKKENNLSKNCGQLWKRFKDLEGKYIKFYDGYGIQYLKVREVDYDSENYEFHISGFGPYLRRGTHDSWTNYVYNKETVLQGYLLQAQEISKEEFKKAKEMLRKKLSHEKTVRNFLEKDKKPLTDLVGKYLKYTQDWTTEYFHLKNIQKETYGDYQCCKIRYDNNRFSVNKKGKITYLTGENIQDTIPFESFKDAVIITEEEFNKAKSGEGFKKQEKPIKIYTKEELKSSILKYTSPDGSIYYLEHPEIPKIGIENKTGKFKNCVVSYGIMISNGGQVHLYTPKINPFNPIVLLIESESDEGFFSRVEKIPDHEWDSLKKFYRDKIVKI